MKYFRFPKTWFERLDFDDTKKGFEFDLKNKIWKTKFEKRNLKNKIWKNVTRRKTVSNWTLSKEVARNLKCNPRNLKHRKKAKLSLSYLKSGWKLNLLSC